MIISFDFDGVIDFEKTQTDKPEVNHVDSLIKTFIEAGHRVICITSRDIKHCDHAFSNRLKELGIESFFTTSHSSKVEIITQMNVDLHFDDDWIEVYQINQRHQGRGVLVNLNVPLDATYEY
jgi:uncharacterized HAD superfamily protein